MANVIEKMRDFFSGYDEDDYEEDYQVVEDNTVDIEPQYFDRKRGNTSSQNKVVTIHKNAKMDIMNFKMLKYDVTGDICNYIKMRKPVVVNMQHLRKEEAQRALDYLTGASFALDGHVEKVAENIFIFSPENVNISTITEEVRQKSNFVFQQ